MDAGILEDIGFTKSEIKIYIALLDLGSSRSGEVIEKSGLQSSVVHRALRSLIGKGLISYVKVGKDNVYSSCDPENLIDFVDNKKKRLGDLLPELRARSNSRKGDYSTEMFFGKKAMFSVLSALIMDAEPNELFCSFSLIEPHEDKEIVDFYYSYNLRRREKRLNVKVLVNQRVKPIYEKNYSRDLLKKAKVRYTHFNFPQGIVIFRNCVIFVHWGDKPFAIKNKNPEMAEQFKEFFLEFYEKEKNAY